MWSYDEMAVCLGCNLSFPNNSWDSPCSPKSRRNAFRIWMADSTLPGSWSVVLFCAFGSQRAKCTCEIKSPPASGPTMGVVAESAGATGQADGSDVVAESDGAAELHQRNVVVPECVLIVGMDDNLNHVALDLVWVGTTLSLPSQVNGEC